MNGLLKNTYLWAIYLFLYIPIIILVIFSFNNSDHSLLWHGFTLRWYRVLFQDGDLGMVTLHSLEIGFLAASIATFLGFLGAISLNSYRLFGKGFWDLFIFMLIIIPDLVMGISLLLLYKFAHFSLGFWSLLCAHITLCLPFTIVTITGRLSTISTRLIEASQDLGASEWALYRRILLPLLMPAVVAAWLLSFTLSLDDVIISYFVSGPDFEILPLRIFSLVKVGVSPEINALCSIIVLLTFITTLSLHYLLGNKK
jgi:spermidine/putrescine transport system permease protein